MPAAHYATGLQLDHRVASQLHSVRHFAICLQLDDIVESSWVASQSQASCIMCSRLQLDSDVKPIII
jgi:hypothetical protein